MAIALAVGAQDVARADEGYTWRNVQIHGGGFVTGIVFHPSEAGLVYARTDVGGAYRRDGEGGPWVPLTDWIGRSDSNDMGIESIGLDPTDPQRVYLAAGTYTQSFAPNGAILRSVDRGETWTVIPVPFKMGANEDGRSNGERLVVDPNRPSLLYFGSRKNGLWKSVDHGSHWEPVGTFPVTSTPNGVGISFVLLDAASGSSGNATPIIYAGVSQDSPSLYRSTDAGATWSPVPGAPGGMPHHGALGAAGTFFVTIGNGPGPNGVTGGAVWRYEPGANRWTDVSPVRPTGSDLFGYAGLSVDAQHQATLVVSTIDRWNRGDQIYRSTDAGGHWTSVLERSSIASSTPWTFFHAPTSGTTHWMGDVDIDPFDSSHATYVTGWGVFASHDLSDGEAGVGVRWFFDDDGLEETVPLALVSPPLGAPLLSALGDIGGFRHDSLDASPSDADFYEPIGSTNTCIDFAEADPSRIVRVHYGDARGSYSDDGGASWRDFSSAPKAAHSKGPGGVAVSADGGSILWWPKGSRAFLSTNAGVTWKKAKKSPASPGDYRTGWPTADRVNPHRFYIYDLDAGVLYASANGGAKFAAKAKGLPTNGGALRCVAGYEGHLWLPGGGSGLLRSTDGGATFSRVASVDEAYQIGFGRPADGQSYPAAYVWGMVGGVIGIFRSDDEAVSWTRINDDEHQFGWINAIAGDPRRYGRVYLATGGRGIVYGEP